MRVAGILVFAAAGFSGAANAQAQPASVERSVTVAGVVSQSCTVDLPVLLTDQTPVNVSGNGTAFTIDRLTDPETLATNAASVAVGFNAVCNYPHRVVVESLNNGLWRDVAANTANGFADAVPYVATLQWAGVETPLSVDAGFRGTRDFTVNVTHPAEGRIALRIAILPGASNTRANAPLLAGVYRDTIRVTVGPQ